MGVDYHVMSYEEPSMIDLETAIEGDISLNSYEVISVSVSAYNGKFYALVAYKHTQGGN